MANPPPPPRTPTPSGGAQRSSIPTPSSRRKSAGAPNAGRQSLGANLSALPRPSSRVEKEGATPVTPPPPRTPTSSGPSQRSFLPTPGRNAPRTPTPTGDAPPRSSLPTSNRRKSTGAPTSGRQSFGFGASLSTMGPPSGAKKLEAESLAEAIKANDPAKYRRPAAGRETPEFAGGVARPSSSRSSSSRPPSSLEKDESRDASAASAAAVAEAVRKKEQEWERKLEQAQIAHQLQMTELEAKAKQHQERANKLEKEATGVLEKAKAVELEMAKAATELEKDKAANLEKAKEEAEAHSRELSAKLAESEALVSSLKAAAEESKSSEAVPAASSSAMDALLQAKEAELEEFRSRIERLEADWERERTGLGDQVNLLRQAGQETIGLYEARVNEIETQRYEAEERLKHVQEAAARAIAAAKASVQPEERAKQASRAAEIDNESLKEQLSHTQTKVTRLEDALSDAKALMEREEVNAKRRREKNSEMESNLRKEIKRLKMDVEKVLKAEAVARARADELEDALQESQIALENERAEVEGLRADVENLEGLYGGGNGDEERIAELNKRAEAERARAEQEIDRLKGLLEGARSGKREAGRQAEEARRQTEHSLKEVDDLRNELRAAEKEKLDLELYNTELQDKRDQEQSAVIAELRKALEAKVNDIEILRRSGATPDTQMLKLRERHGKELRLKDEEIRSLKARLGNATKLSLATGTVSAPSQDQPGSPVLSAPSHTSLQLTPESNAQTPMRRSSTASAGSKKSRHSNASTLNGRDEYTAMQDKIFGLQYIIQNLTDENISIGSQNRLLVQETESLKEKMRALEITVERLVADIEESAAAEEGNGRDGGDHSRSAGDTAKTLLTLTPATPLKMRGPPTPGSTSKEVIRLQKELAEQTARMERLTRSHQLEVGSLKERLEDIEGEHRKEVRALNKEVSELESLVEARIFKEDELEQELARLRKEVSRESRGSKTLAPSPPSVSVSTSEAPKTPRRELTSLQKVAGEGASKSGATKEQHKERANDEEELYCDLCESAGHEITDCVLFSSRRGDRASADAASSRQLASPAVISSSVKLGGAIEDEDAFCDNCEILGHATEE